MEILSLSILYRCCFLTGKSLYSKLWGLCFVCKETMQLMLPSMPPFKNMRMFCRICWIGALFTVSSSYLFENRFKPNSLVQTARLMFLGGPISNLHCVVLQDARDGGPSNGTGFVPQLQLEVSRIRTGTPCQGSGPEPKLYVLGTGPGFDMGAFNFKSPSRCRS